MLRDVFQVKKPVIVKNKDLEENLNKLKNYENILEEKVFGLFDSFHKYLIHEVNNTIKEDQDIISFSINFMLNLFHNQNLVDNDEQIEEKKNQEIWRLPLSEISKSVQMTFEVDINDRRSKIVSASLIIDMSNFIVSGKSFSQWLKDAVNDMILKECSDIPQDSSSAHYYLLNQPEVMMFSFNSLTDKLAFCKSFDSNYLTLHNIFSIPSTSLISKKYIAKHLIFKNTKLNCSSMYPTHPHWGRGTCRKCLHLPPIPQLDKKMLLKYFTQNVFYKIRSLKCLFNLIIFKVNL